MAMLLAALLLEPAARLIRLPLSAALVLGGFAGAQWIVSLGIDTGLRWYHFHDLVFLVFLPALIFGAAIAMDARLLLRNLVPILLLTLPLLLLATLLSAALLFFSIGHPQGFPWIAALICGALISATDPVAISELSKRLPVPKRLLTLMEGESLFNDATTVVLFMLFLSAVSAPGVQIDVLDAAMSFTRLTLGGLAVGLLFALVASLLIGWLDRAVIVSLLAAYGSYLIAEIQLEVSGVMASLGCGLLLSHRLRQSATERLAQVEAWWNQLAWIANSSVFLLCGATITLLMFQERWLAMLLGIGAAILTRVIGVWIAAGLTNLIPGQQPVSRGYRVMMSAAGLRGAVTLALALSLPLELEGWWTVQSIAYGVVLFSLLVQAPGIEPLTNRLLRKGHL
jgi:CPA1 family monovalent cation:H+ antiporter